MCVYVTECDQWNNNLYIYSEQVDRGQSKKEASSYSKLVLILGQTEILCACMCVCVRSHPLIRQIFRIINNYKIL